MHKIYLSLMVSLVFLLSHKSLGAQGEESQDSSRVEKARTTDDQLRQIQIDKAKLDMDLAKKLMGKKEDELTNLRDMIQEANNIVTVQEVNRAEEEYERGKGSV